MVMATSVIVDSLRFCAPNNCCASFSCRSTSSRVQSLNRQLPDTVTPLFRSDRRSPPTEILHHQPGDKLEHLLLRNVLHRQESQSKFREDCRPMYLLKSRRL